MTWSRLLTHICLSIILYNQTHIQVVYQVNLEDGSLQSRYYNSRAHERKIITNVLPITRSTYAILGFSKNLNWDQGETTLLRRLDLIERSQLYNYTIPNSEGQITCFRTLYIEYSRYFLASFSGNNGVLAYDMTKTTRAPERVFHPEGLDHEHLAYLEYSNVILMSVGTTPRLYGYSMVDKKQYQIELPTDGEVTVLLSFKSSDFFVVFQGFGSTTKFKIFNLNGDLNHMEIVGLKQSTQAGLVYIKEFDGRIYFPNYGEEISYKFYEKNRNPSCSSLTRARYSFTNFDCEECSSDARKTVRGVCENRGALGFLEYLNTKLRNLPYDEEKDSEGLKPTEPVVEPEGKSWFRLILWILLLVFVIVILSWFIFFIRDILREGLAKCCQYICKCTGMDCKSIKNCVNPCCTSINNCIQACCKGMKNCCKKRQSTQRPPAPSSVNRRPNSQNPAESSPSNRRQNSQRPPAAPSVDRRPNSQIPAESSPLNSRDQMNERIRALEQTVRQLSSNPPQTVIPTAIQVNPQQNPPQPPSTAVRLESSESNLPQATLPTGVPMNTRPNPYNPPGTNYSVLIQDIYVPPPSRLDPPNMTIQHGGNNQRFNQVRPRRLPRMDPNSQGR